MSRYLAFQQKLGPANGGDNSQQGQTLLIEVGALEVEESDGVTKAGLAEMVSNTVVRAKVTFQEALQDAIGANVAAFWSAIERAEPQPTDVEVTFGLKVTGEASNVAVGKIGGEVNYTIKLCWKDLGAITELQGTNTGK